MQHERRRHPRVVVACPAKVFDTRQRLIVKGKTVDVAAGGVRVMGPMKQQPQPGTEVEVEVELLLPDATRLRKVQRTATIRRVDVMGEWTALALEFTKLVDV